LGVIHPCRCTDEGEIWHGGGNEGTFGPLLRAAVSPLRGEKPQNRPLSKLITGRLALRAMLPVIKVDNRDKVACDEIERCCSDWFILMSSN